MTGAKMFNGKSILVTGGTGSFGSKFVEIVLKRYKPKKLIIFSRDEMKQHEMAKTFNQRNIRYFIGDVRDPVRLHRAFLGVDIIVHAAALKIVPTAEYNPFEAVKTNIIGAENIINMSIDNGVKKVIALSTDKAANPANLYGATKLCAEKMFIAANNYSPSKGTQFSVVRYGNVFGSRGSIVPYFKECSKTGIIPITDKRMTRFWITLSQGIEFVISCIKSMQGGEIFIPKMPSMKIIDLVQVLAPECKIKIIGIRPGEKLHETLVPVDDIFSTIEKTDRFITYPKVIFGRENKHSGVLLKEDFIGYRSDNNTRWLTAKELKKMVANK
jgi:UDP-N-acetylglucosamine 4,6-dehydratase/5-epimerase